MNRCQILKSNPILVLRVPGGLGYQVSRQSAHEGGKVINCRHRLYMMSLSEGHSAAGRIMSMKNSDDTIGIEPVIFRLVAQYLSQLRHRVSLVNFQSLFLFFSLFYIVLDYITLNGRIHGERFEKELGSSNPGTVPVCSYRN